ncbi:MAG: hypothetical protein QM756_12410 [Polyangiaceae bacterium]
MPRALLDLQRFGAREHFPSDAGRAQIVEGDPLGGGALLVQIGTLDLGARQVLAQRRGEVLQGRHPVLGFLVLVAVLHHAAGALQRLEQRGEGRVDRHLAGDAGLGALHEAGAQVERLVNVDVAVIKVHVRPFERGQLPRAHVQVDREGVQPPPAQGHFGTAEQR